ncbi:MAG: DNA methyltransferase [Methanoculleus sp.]
MKWSSSDMEAEQKKILKPLVLTLRHLLEGRYDEHGIWHGGDLEARMNSLGVWWDRDSLPPDEVTYQSAEDRHAREVIDAYLTLREEAGIDRKAAIEEFVRETAYTWANRLLVLRCMEARDLIDPQVVLTKEVYGGRSQAHNRLVQRHPERCSGPDGGLFAMFKEAFVQHARYLPLLFDPKAPGVALRPSVAALKKCIGLLSGTESVNGNGPATDEVFAAPDALGWAYQYWNTEEKDRVFEKVRTKKAKIQGADIIPATQLYTEPYMVKFLVQNSLGATWMGMYPDSDLSEGWEYYVKDADRAPVRRKNVENITFLDPACGSGHFLIEAFDLFYRMYEAEGKYTDGETICKKILSRNLYGIDIDERAVQIARAALWMKAAERVFDFSGTPKNIIATNIRLPKGKDHLKAFLARYPEDTPLAPALESIFEGLEHADELGSLLQIEEPVEQALRSLRTSLGGQTTLPIGDFTTPTTDEEWEAWKEGVVERLADHFKEEGEAADLSSAFFSQNAGKGVRLFELLSKRVRCGGRESPVYGIGEYESSIKEVIRKLIMIKDNMTSLQFS